MNKYLFCACCQYCCQCTTGHAQKGKWIVLFNGGATDKLRGYGMQSFPDQAWKVEDGALVAQTGVPNVDLVTTR